MLYFIQRKETFEVASLPLSCLRGGCREVFQSSPGGEREASPDLCGLEKRKRNDCPTSLTEEKRKKGGKKKIAYCYAKGEKGARLHREPLNF